MSRRRVIVVDTETSGLLDTDQVVECGWADLHTGEGAAFVPLHSTQWVLDHGDPYALELNGYRERLQFAPRADATVVRTLADALNGAVLAGSNPAFDARHLPTMFTRYGLAARWHHRLLDLSAYAAGKLRIDVRELPGLAEVCKRLGVDLPDHTVKGDVTSTAMCFRALDALDLG